MDAAEARQHLVRERERLLALRASFAEEHLDDEREDVSIGELSGHDQHQADVGTETFEREKDLSILEQVEAELADVEHALRRLEEGTYGICEACGEPIGEERLQAMPAARFCVADQAAVERDMSARRAARE